MPAGTSYLSQRASRPDYGSQFEILVSVLYNRIVRPGHCVVDGGANAGLHACALAPLVGPSGKLIAFEPIPQIFASLKANLTSFDCELYQIALGDHPGRVSFLVDDVNPALSHIRHPFDKDTTLVEVSVDVVTVDQIVANRCVSFIKFDLEGADFPALSGSRSTFQAGHPPVIFENSRAWAAECYAYSMEDFFQFFDELEYDVFDLHGCQLTRNNWNDENVAFEFIAYWRRDAGRGNLLRRVIKFFWEQAPERPPLNEWIDCVVACRDADDYMRRWHGDDWLEKAARVTL